MEALPIQRGITKEEAAAQFREVVREWVKFMEQNGRAHGAFRIDSVGLHTFEMSFEVGCHADAFVELGWEVVSHSVVLLRIASGADKTVTSLFVRRKRQWRAVSSLQ
jgi:hypothetical protein